MADSTKYSLIIFSISILSSIFMLIFILCYRYEFTPTDQYFFIGFGIFVPLMSYLFFYCLFFGFFDSQKFLLNFSFILFSLLFFWFYIRLFFYYNAPEVDSPSNGIYLKFFVSMLYLLMFLPIAVYFRSFVLFLVLFGLYFILYRIHHRYVGSPYYFLRNSMLGFCLYYAVFPIFHIDFKFLFLFCFVFFHVLFSSFFYFFHKWYTPNRPPSKVYADDDDSSELDEDPVQDSVYKKKRKKKKKKKKK